MATYKYKAYVEQNQSAEFDKVWSPGTATPHSGIYRCQSCGREAVSTGTHPLPPQDHLHQHTAEQGKVLWRLVAYADHTPK